MKQLRQWRRIVLFIDHNEHAIEGKLGKALADREGLNLREAILSHTRASPGATFFWGLCQIDILWVSSDLDISNMCVMPFGFGVGNHRAFILDIPLESLVGINPVKIVRPASRRLNSCLPECGKAYIASLESNIVQQRLLEHLQAAHTGGFPAEETARRVITIDKEGKTYMRHAEKIFRKIKCCKILFSPEASIWICRVQVYYSLLQYHLGRIKHCGNLKRAARKCNTPNPLSLSIPNILACLRDCKRACTFYQDHGQCFYRKHLNN